MLGACVGAAGTAVDEIEGVDLLAGVRSWAIQLQGLDDDVAIRALAAASVDMVVIEPGRSQHGMSYFATAEVVRRIQRGRGETMASKRCLAYLNIGQAEDYRSYWRDDWRAPTAAAGGQPGFLVGVDPDGWSGNYPVAYWDPGWKAVLFGSEAALLDQVIADGFDGAYLDWVMGFEDRAVVAAATAAGVDPAEEMERLVAELRDYARARNPLFVLVAQNAVGLAELRPGLLDHIDALSQEDLSFRGAANAGWDELAAGDTPAVPTGEWSTERLGQRLRRFAAAGLPVFTLDYAAREANVTLAASRSRALGLVPCVTRSPLDRLPPHQQQRAGPRPN